MSVIRVVATACLIYVVIVAALRVVGERALAKMSAYDAIVTVALGSLVAAIPLTTSISVVDGVAAIGAYLGLQELTRWAQARFARMRQLVRERPHLVGWEGALLTDRLADLNITPDEVRAAARRAGVASLAQIQAIVLENDGEWSVVRRSAEPTDMSAFEGLDIPR